jgi:probable rRNA maturation factor
MIRVAIACPQDTVVIDRTLMRRAARTVLRGEGVKNAQISLAFVDNLTIQHLNRRYLKHNRPTDVLSFPLGDANDRILSGEIVIGAEVAAAEANRRGKDLQAEAALYVIHGMLHLCGLDDKTRAGAAEMRKRESHYLRQLGLPDVESKPD